MGFTARERSVRPSRLQVGDGTSITPTFSDAAFQSGTLQANPDPQLGLGRQAFHHTSDSRRRSSSSSVDELYHDHWTASAPSLVDVKAHKSDKSQLPPLSSNGSILKSGKATDVASNGIGETRDGRPVWRAGETGSHNFEAGSTTGKAHGHPKESLHPWRTILDNVLPALKRSLEQLRSPHDDTNKSSGSSNTRPLKPNDTKEALNVIGDLSKMLLSGNVDDVDATGDVDDKVSSNAVGDLIGNAKIFDLHWTILGVALFIGACICGLLAFAVGIVSTTRMPLDVDHRESVVRGSHRMPLDC